MKNNKHRGPSFDEFLEEEGILEEVNASAIKTIIAHHLKLHMEKNDITQEQMAKMLKTSHPALKRLLDPHNYSVTLLTFNRAASVLGKKININLSDTNLKTRATHTKLKK
jgi:antitoxin HicB